MNNRDENISRKEIFTSSKRIVIKVGSAILTNAKGIKTSFIADLAKEISVLKASGKEVILVSSGAVAAGRKKLGLPNSQNVSVKEKQALAAIGQASLMQIYEDAFGFYELGAAQVLLTHGDLSDRNRYLNVRNTILTLLKFGITPIINENDTVSTEELKFGDNDSLAGLLCNLLEADACIILTDVDALYDANPNLNVNAKPIYFVEKIDAAIEKMASSSAGSLGTGGMQSKIKAAKIVHDGGGAAVIAPGGVDRVLYKLFAGESIGTFFMPCKERMKGRKQWIAHVLKPKGKIILDSGAGRAICQHNKSLLPSGIVEVVGDFQRGDTIECYLQDGHKIGVGLVNFSAEDTNKIKGLHTKQISTVLDSGGEEEVIHRDNLVILSS
ncbi:MAG: glutamate 5-kinase [Desulfotalea sp.]